jgi:hypothetical protein
MTIDMMTFKFYLSFPHHLSHHSFQYVKYKIYYFQAICCFLWGLEEFADDPNVAHHITDTIVGRTLVASVKSLPNPKKAGVGIVLFDTSTDEDLNMNTVLIENITKDAIAPRLPPVSSPSAQLYFYQTK